MTKVRLGGVPEHFNFPWHYAIERNYFKENGIEIEWQDYPGGTGAMVSALKNNELDMAILLTEGAVKEIANEAPFKIFQTYIESPLVWGIHTSSSNPNASLEELGHMKYAISRKGSGSHLIAFVHAQEQGHRISQDQMVVVNDLKGALQSLRSLETDLFLWEKFTTKPFVDSGELKRLGEFPTPWPCFVLVALDSWMSSNSESLQRITEILHYAIQELLNDKSSMISSISAKYKLDALDISEWLEITKWSLTTTISENMLQKVQFYLEELGLTKEIASKYLVYDKNILN